MYQPRHARPRRVPKVPVLGALLLTPLVGLPLRSAPPSPAPALLRTAVTAPPRSFDATPVVVPIAAAPHNSSSLPALGAVHLPASVAPGVTPRPARFVVSARDRDAFHAASSSVASAGCQLPWQLLAAIRAVVAERPTRLLLDGHDGYLMADFDQGRYDGSSTVDGPVGPMGLLPWTFDHVKATDSADPASLPDAALAAARFLCATHASLVSGVEQRTALLAFDTDPAFATAVLATERR